MTRNRLVAALISSGLLAVSACGSDNDALPPATTVAATTVATTAVVAPVTTVAKAEPVSASGITAERCEANKKAGKITYLSGFDFAATASIVEVVVAAEKGYFTKMCLDVDIKASFSTANYPLVAANTAQFSSSGSYTEMLNFNKDGAELVAVTHAGKQGIDALLVRADGVIKTPADLKGKTIGVKGALPPSEVALLNKYGLKQGVDYKEVLVPGFDPKAHWALPIDALPVFKSNEPNQLDQAGLKYVMFDPAKEGIPGSFGLIYTNKKFLTEHSGAAQDFVRAAMKGMADAIANPDEATALCFKRIVAGGNKNFLSEPGEKYRWAVEAKIVTESSKGKPVGIIDPSELNTLVDAYVAAGVLKTKPKVEGTYDEGTVKGVYGSDGKVIWPA